MFLLKHHVQNDVSNQHHQYAAADDDTNSNTVGGGGGTDYYNDYAAVGIDTNQDGGDGTDYYDHPPQQQPHPSQNDYHTDEAAANAAAVEEEFVVKLNLRRLLYRMERFENFEGCTEEIDGDAINSSVLNKSAPSSNTSTHQYHQLLSRAQYCQTLWEQVAAHNVEDTDDARKLEYRELSMRVDTVCRRAMILAEATKEQQQQQQQLPAATNVDMDAVVHSLFFSGSASSSSRNDENDEDSRSYNDDFAAEEEFAAVGEESDEDKAESDDDEDTEEEEEIGNQRKRSRNKNKSVGGDHTKLQESQWETMETAIAMMAQQMKQATLGLSETLQHQTTATLDELEDVAEQNVVEVSKVADNVQHHNKKQSKTNFGNYIQLLSILGLFVFVLVTIFTIPKSSVHVFFKPNGQPTLPVRLFQKVSSGIQRAVIVVQHYSISRRVPSGVGVANNDDADDENENEPDELVLLQQQQREKERLNEIVQQRNQHGQHSRNTMDEGHSNNNNSDNQRRTEPEENTNLKEDILITAPETINVDTIMASLKEYQERVEHELLVTEDDGSGGHGSGRVVEGIQQEEAGTRRTDSIDTNMQQQQKHATESSSIGTKTSPYNEDTTSTGRTRDGANGNDDDHATTAFAVKREGVASQRISPRDLRVAAGADDDAQLAQYVHRAPEHLNRQDKYGWTLLHYAVRAHRLRNIRFLLQYHHDGQNNSYKCDPSIRSKEGQTAFDMAHERFGSEHPVTGIFFELGFEEKEHTNENIHTSTVQQQQQAEAAAALLAKEQQEAVVAAVQFQQHTTASESPLPPGWSIKWDPTHERNFYHNSVGPVSQWERPNKKQEQEAAAVHRKQQQQAEAAAAEQRTANKEHERSIQEGKRRKLFPPISAILEDDDDIIDDTVLAEKRKRLDALLGRGDEL